MDKDDFVLFGKDENFVKFDEDLDLAIAISLQEESSENDATHTGNKKIDPSSSQKLGLTDPQWELIDPNPDIYSLFHEFNSQFFYGKLLSVEVKWSRRMTLCAGVCSYEGRGGLCSVRLSLPLLKLRPRSDLVETLLHEMIHAYLFVTANNKDHDAHGPQFLSHMNRINKQAGTKISVYHSFHDEVDFQRKHWWKCDGPCSQRRPFFGIVKRAMNRAPGPNDRWWSQHQSSCGGKFTKVVEPENFKQKNIKRKKIHETTDEKASANIKSFFLPTTSTNDKHVLDKKKVNTEFSKKKSILSEEENNVSIDRSGYKPSFPSESSDVSSKISPFSGQGFVLGSSTKPTSLLSKIRKELGYTPHLNSPGISNGDTKPCIKQAANDIPKVDTKTLKNDTHEKQLKKDSKPSAKRTKKEKLLEGNLKISQASASNSVNDLGENKLKQSSLKKYVNSSPKQPERLNISQDLVSSLAVVMCPVCSHSFTNSEINLHLDNCLNVQIQ